MPNTVNMSNLEPVECDHVIGKMSQSWEVTEEFTISELKDLVKDKMLAPLLAEETDNETFGYKRHHYCYKCGTQIDWDMISKLKK